MDNDQITALASDAEGEDDETLYVSRKRVMELFAKAKELHDLYTNATCINNAESKTIDINCGKMKVLNALFGSKCLPDEVAVAENATTSEPKPSEPKEKADKHLDTILKDGFRNERRLNIAVQMAKGILSNPVTAKSVVVSPYMEISELTLAEKAVKITDALLAECEKGSGK